MVNRLPRRNCSPLPTHIRSSVDSGERSTYTSDQCAAALQALQVPWMVIFPLSLISVETGQIIAKTGRALTQNGSCRWTEDLSEYIWVPHDDSSKGLERCLYKLVISMGSGRSGTLGELTVEIQCLTPRANTRNDRWTDTDSFTEDANASDDQDITSDVSDGRIINSVESSMSSNFMYTSQAGGPINKRKLLPNKQRQDSREGHFVNHRQDSGIVSHSIPASPLRTFGSPADFILEAEGTTVEELKAEAITRERHARNYLKVLLDESEVKEQTADTLKLQVQDGIHTELEEEIKFQRDLNDNLSLQFNKTQESNLELVSVLQELEETIEKQRLEIESLKPLQDKINELERDCNELTHENLDLVSKLKESGKNLSACVDSIEDSEVNKLEYQIQQLKEEAKKRELDRIDAGYLQTRCDDLENKCVELEANIQGFKDKACYLDGELDKFAAQKKEGEDQQKELLH
ncbi:hypothetical protein Tco_0128404 [Tanacetum coccineum]